jgi:type 1 fimbria pilin
MSMSNVTCRTGVNKVKRKFMKLFMVMNKLGRVLLIALEVLLVILLLSRVTYACTPSVFVLAAPASLNINPTVAVGSVIGTTSMNFGSGSGTTDCGVPYNVPSATYSLVGEGVPNGKLYPTSIPGISYRGKMTWGSPFDPYWPFTTTFSVQGAGITPGSVIIEFVKTGPILPGQMQPQMLGYVYINGAQFFSMSLGTPIIIVPTTPACTVTQSAITVNLDDVNSSQLATTGSTSKDKAFNIPLKCTTAAKISLAFSGNIADSSNAVFSNLSGSANAASVGIQILSGSTPVPTTAGNYLNLGSINGSISVPLIARYYALVNNPDGGGVSAIAYATIVYN